MLKGATEEEWEASMIGLQAEIQNIQRGKTKKTAAAREKAKRKSEIVIGPIDGVLPFRGMRNPLNRSTTSYKIGTVLSSAANQFVPMVHLYDSETEEAFSVEAQLQPNVVAIECQPARVKLPKKTAAGKHPHHYFDLRITLACGQSKLIYVRGQVSLNARSSAATIAEIVRHTPKSMADAIVVISDASFTRARRDNNRRILISHRMPNPNADKVVSAIMDAKKDPIRISELVQLSELPKATAFQAILRMIGAGKIGAERDNIIDYPSQCWRVCA
jgi:hypothetical protein